MPKKLEDTGRFIGEFGSKLDLEVKQIEYIDDLEYNGYKERFWQLKTFTEDRTYVISFLRQVLNVLTPGQIQKLKALRSEYHKKQIEREKEKEARKFERQQSRLKSLNLSEDEIHKILLIQKNYHQRRLENKRGLRNVMTLDQAIINDETEAVQKLRSILSESQLNIYRSLLKSEKNQRHKFHVNVIRDQFKHRTGIKINDSIAEELTRLEDLYKKRDASGNYLSDWERLDQEYVLLESLLSEEDFEIYKKSHFDRLRKMQEEYKEQDKYCQNQVLVVKKNLVYYSENVLPYVCRLRKKIERVLSKNQKEGIKRLKCDYLKKIDKNEIRIRDQHHRYNRNLKPNELKLDLLRVKMDKLVPKASYLKDHPLTNKIYKDDLKERVVAMHEDLKPVFSDYKEFQIRSYEEHGGTYDGFTYIAKLTKEERELMYLSYLLVYPDYEKNLGLLK